MIEKLTLHGALYVSLFINDFITQLLFPHLAGYGGHIMRAYMGVRGFYPK